ncbi:MAG: lipid A biosynthesis acyltransferase [Hirschia sp.]|nr:lipid A biosynthesis acyltransferase [Hirschia sp.]MBF18476.1 lipid A biosynthesis acyltransferase [Hirschia sp.]
MTDEPKASSATDKSRARDYLRPKDVDNRASWTQRLQWRLEAAAWYASYWDRFKAMDIETASRRGAKIVGWAGPRFAGSANRTARRNLALAFPDWSQDQIEAMLEKSWENFGMIAGEMPHVPKIRLDGDDPRLELVGGEILDDLRARNQPAVLISAHLSNWEVLMPPLHDKLPDTEITYRSINNPHIDACIADMRQENGAYNLAAKGVGTRALMRALSQKRSVALMNDQKFNEGIAVPFFGHNAMTAPGPTRLAMRYKAPLVIFTCKRIGLARYRATFYDPFHPESSGTEDENVYNTLLKINGFLEERIREAPEQWFWQHNRWPKQAWADAGVI